MAPSTEVLDIKKKDSIDPKDNLWSSILSDVQARGNTKLPSCKSVLFLGDNESGKTTLVAKLQGVEDPKKGSGLEYAYIDVRDEYRDDQTRLSVWVLDGDPGHANLLKFALNEETYTHTLVILTVAMTTPWGILDQLQNWASILADHIDTLKIGSDVRQQCRQNLIRSWQEYIEPGDELESPLRRTSRNLGDTTDGDGIDPLDDGSSPLPEGVLTHNLGLDIVVVVTKTDYMSTLEKEHDYRDEHLDFMQQWIRKFCLQYGAALFYTSAKEDKNCDLLYKYLTHRIYGLPFRTPALVVEKDAVFIPIGWDNLKKISILHENLHTCKATDYYRDIIVQPITRKTVSNRETEILAEDEQAFLTRHQQVLQAGGGLASSGVRVGESPMRSTSMGIKSSPRPVGAVGAQGSPKKIEGTKVVGAPGGERVLANFFNSLLNKKTSPGAPPGLGQASPKPGTPGEIVVDKASMRSDAAAELDRLTRAKKASSPTEVDLNASDC
ncbi:cytoplasmic dynein 1 light intermediate chain 1 isoform X2 [Chrysoperla carnea]|nr:cytoplasmic dynein 1 light intermediate chain 1 isoform X2 [Chrysoperla carnea]XP_044738142.1 cytoplasmic dynein 1 light intermediate chain 1 isoform X2 [Chrysoperla carnea]